MVTKISFHLKEIIWLSKIQSQQLEQCVGKKPTGRVKYSPFADIVWNFARSVALPFADHLVQTMRGNKKRKLLAFALFQVVLSWFNIETRFDFCQLLISFGWSNNKGQTKREHCLSFHFFKQCFDFTLKQGLIDFFFCWKTNSPGRRWRKKKVLQAERAVKAEPHVTTWPSG